MAEEAKVEAPAVEPEVDDQDDIRESLTEAWKQAEAEETPETPREAVPPEKDHAPSPEPGASPETDAGVQSETDAPPEPAPATSPEPAPAAPPAAEAEKGLEPHESWTQVHKEQFAELPDDARRMVLDMHHSFQADYTRKTQEVAEIRKAVEPYREYVHLTGMTEGQVLDHDLRVRTNLMSPSADVRRDTLLYLAREAGVVEELRAAFAGQQQQAPGQQPESDDTDPYLQQQIQAAVAPLQQQVQQVQGWRQQQEQAGRNSMAEELMARVDGMKAAKDESGNLKYPYFGDLEADLAEQVRVHINERGTIPDLAPLYEQAVWANPATRNHLLRQREQAQSSAASRAAGEAKAKTVSMRGNPAQAEKEPVDDQDDIRMALQRAWERTAS